MNNDVVKCIACGEIIQPLDQVCPSCNYVQNVSGNINFKLDDQINELETLVAELKSFDDNRLGYRFLQHLHISMPVFCGLSFIIGWTYNSNVLAGVFFVCIFLGIFVVRKIKKSLLPINKTFKLVLSDYEKHYRITNLYFGNDSRTKLHLENIQKEIETLKKLRQQNIYIELAIYPCLILFLLVLGIYTTR